MLLTPTETQDGETAVETTDKALPAALAQKQHRLLYRPNEVAEALGLGRATVFRMIAAGELPVIRFGRAVRVPAADLERWLRDRTEYAA
jgi:excisionase family DNA binding protein